MISKRFLFTCNYQEDWKAHWNINQEHFCFPLIASAFVDPAKLSSFYQELITPLIKCPVKVLDLMQPPRKHIVK